MSLKIIYAGTPEFAVPALEALLQKTDNQVVAVYTQPDKPAGRGRKLQASPVKQCAQLANIPVYQPDTLKQNPEVQEILQSLQPDIMIVAAYGLLLPQKILDIPKLGCINLHASLLPRWRGAAPIQRAILSGDKITGVGIMQMEKGLDTGPIWLNKALEIKPRQTAGKLQEQLANLAAQALLEALPLITKQEMIPIPQAETGIAYAHKLEKQEANINWCISAWQIERQVYAFNPWPIAQTGYLDKKLRIYQAFAYENNKNNAMFIDMTPGTIVQVDIHGIHILCQEGILCATQVQLTGGKVLSAQEFSKGHPLEKVLLG